MPKHRRRRKSAAFIYDMDFSKYFYEKRNIPKIMTQPDQINARDEFNSKRLEVHSSSKNIQNTVSNEKLEMHSNNEKLAVYSNTLDIWDEIALKEIQRGEHTNLIDARSKYQNINLVQVNDLRLYLDKQLQFSSVDEQIYHEALVHPIMSQVENPKHILILGGGDALALREVLKYTSVLHVDLVDLDEEMIRMAREVPEIVSLNKRALFDDRVTVHICDAKEFLQSQSLLYDVIIIDFPDPATEVLSQIYTKEFFTYVSHFLAEGGALVCQSNSPADAPLVYWSIAKTMKSAELTVKSYHTIVPSFGNDWGFHIATNQSAVLKRIEKLSVTVPHQTLPPTLSPLFQFKSELLEQQDFAVLNTQDNLTLHDCYRKDMQF